LGFFLAVAARALVWICGTLIGRAFLVYLNAKGGFQYFDRMLPRGSVATPVGIKYSTSEIFSEQPEFPYGLRIVVQTDRPRDDAKIVIDTDNAIGRGYGHLVGLHPGCGKEVLLSDKRRWEYHIASPEFGPDTPAVVELFSDRAIKINSVFVL
jgi:hypothetical protein